MAALPINPGSAGAPPPPQGAGGNQARMVVEEFKGVAQQVQMLAQKYPEASDVLQQILPLLLKGMTQVAGDPNRTPPTAAPPVG